MKRYQFRSIRKWATSAAVALGASVALTSVASAGTSVVDFKSSTNMKGLGSFSGTASLDNSTGLLTIVLNNTSSKGYLYGLAFDLDGSSKAKDMTNDGKHGFKGLGKHGVMVTPYGKYEAGAVDHTSNRHAIAAGGTKTMVFQISGAASDMTAFDLLDNPKGQSIVGTFRGFRHGKKDHAGAAVVIPDSSTGGSTSNSDVPTGSGGTIVPVNTGSNNPTGGSSTGGNNPGGSINLPGGGGGQTPMAIPLPSAAASGIVTLTLLAAASARRKLTAMIA